jgi:hypothetical protein
MRFTKCSIYCILLYTMIYTYTIYYISGAKNDLRFLMVICVSKTCFILYTINHVLHSVHYILYSINMKRHALPGLLVVSVKTSQNDPSCVLQ